MTEKTFAALIFSMVGVLYIGLGIPLLLGRVPPNRLYISSAKRSIQIGPQRSFWRFWYRRLS